MEKKIKLGTLVVFVMMCIYNLNLTNLKNEISLSPSIKQAHAVYDQQYSYASQDTGTSTTTYAQNHQTCTFTTFYQYTTCQGTGDFNCVDNTYYYSTEPDCH